MIVKKIFCSFILKKYKYEVSEFINKSVVIDLDENKFPIAVEILNASKFLNTKKYLLEHVEDGEIIINITEDKIELEISLISLIIKKLLLYFLVLLEIIILKFLLLVLN